LQEQRSARRGTLDSRVAKVAALLNGTAERAICWCDLNAESEALTTAIDGAVEVTGSQSDDEKEAAIESFIAGRSRVLVSKSSICGFGLNLQFARTVAFCGVTHSFEQFYQAIRRSWRFGVAGAVDVHVVSSELEGDVVANLKEKQRKAEELSDETRRHVAAYVREAVGSSKRQSLAYVPKKTIKWPSWLKSEAAQ
jgi:superfamily II DNA or RNA helicase